MTKLALAVLALVSMGASVAMAQHTPPTSFPPELLLPFYDGSGNQIYGCYSPQKKMKPTSVQISDSSLTNIVVSTNTATVNTAANHNLYVGAQVTISGATVVPALNGTYTILTVPSATSYTFTTSGVADATYTDATMVITTTNPLLTEVLWAIQVIKYNASSQAILIDWAGGIVNYTIKCSDRTLY